MRLPFVVFVAALSFAPSGLGSPPRRIYAIGGEVKPPVRVSKCEPRFPAYLKKTRITQPIFVYEVVISSRGAVESVREASEPRLEEPYLTMEKAVRESILCSRFRPATRRGKPVTCAYMLTATVEVR